MFLFAKTHNKYSASSSSRKKVRFAPSVQVQKAGNNTTTTQNQQAQQQQNQQNDMGKSKSIPTTIAGAFASMIPESEMLSKLNLTQYMNWNTAVGAFLFLAFIVIIWRTAQYYINTYREGMTNGTGSSSGSGKVANVHLFSATWCPHCKKAKPEWEYIKDKYNGQTVNGYTVKFVDHDCTDAEAPAAKADMQKYKIGGFPTVKIEKDGQLYDLESNPTRETLEAFIKKTIA